MLNTLVPGPAAAPSDAAIDAAFAELMGHTNKSAMIPADANAQEVLMPPPGGVPEAGPMPPAAPGMPEPSPAEAAGVPVAEPGTEAGPAKEEDPNSPDAIYSRVERKVLEALTMFGIPGQELPQGKPTPELRAATIEKGVELLLTTIGGAMGGMPPGGAPPMGAPPAGGAPPMGAPPAGAPAPPM